MTSLLKVVHVTCAVLSISGYLLRGVWMIRASPWLQKKWVRIVPHIIDTALLGSAILLAIEMRGAEAAEAGTYHDQIVVLVEIDSRGLPCAVAQRMRRLEGTGMAAAHAGEGRWIVAGLVLCTWWQGRRPVPATRQCRRRQNSGRADRNPLDEIAAADRSIHAKLTIARRAAADATRRQIRIRRTDRRTGPPPAEAPAPDAAHALRALIDGLDTERREAFVLTQLVGCSYAEAADICDVKIGTIRSRVARAREELLQQVHAARSA